MAAPNQYVIVRSDLPIDPVTIISDGMLIGRLPECELLLNHPSVSRVQAGIKQVEDGYYLFSLRPRNPVLLNRKPVEENGFHSYRNGKESIRNISHPNRPNAQTAVA